MLFLHAFVLIAQKRAKPYSKGEFRLDVSLPYFNTIRMDPVDEPASTKFGYVGEAFGVEYSISNRTFIELSIGLAATSDFFLPVPVLKEGDYKILGTYFISSTYNHILSRFTVGYGINYSVNVLNQGSNSLRDTLVSDYSDNKVNRAFGITLNSFFRLGRTAHVGLIYKPTFVTIRPETKFTYDYSLSFAFLWRFRLNNKSPKTQDQ